MQLTTLEIEKPETVNFILGQTHFIKSVEAQTGGKIQNQEILDSRQVPCKTPPEVTCAFHGLPLEIRLRFCYNLCEEG